MSETPAAGAKEPNPLTLPDFCLKVPLYEAFFLEDDLSLGIHCLKSYSATLDAYCQECGAISVFNTVATNDRYSGDYISDDIFAREFRCSRDTSHGKLVFIFEVRKKVIRKIGQYPSMADLAYPELQKYRAVLPSEQFQEFTRAVGLVSHGVGIGAFAYLRRIFERLINAAHDRAKMAEGWDENAYAKGRMEETIALLKDQLPDFLVRNTALYSILSKGIHDLTEQECLGAFPAVKLGIEMILDEAIERQAREQKIKDAAKAISLMKGKMTQPKLPDKNT